MVQSFVVSCCDLVTIICNDSRTRMCVLNVIGVINLDQECAIMRPNALFRKCAKWSKKIKGKHLKNCKCVIYFVRVQYVCIIRL